MKVQSVFRNFTESQIRNYYENRCGHELHQYKTQISTLCPIHNDSNPSLSINLETGLWICHAGCGQGDLYEFEMVMHDCDFREAKAEIYKLLNLQDSPSDIIEEARYLYHDAEGKPLFLIARFKKQQPDGTTKKVFAAGHWDEKGNLVKGADAQRTIYHLPEVLAANVVLV